LNCRCPWPCCCTTSSCCSVCPRPASVQGDQCIGPGPEFRGSPIPAGNCGPVSSDVYVLDRHVRILYEFMFYIYNLRHSLHFRIYSHLSVIIFLVDFYHFTSRVGRISIRWVSWHDLSYRTNFRSRHEIHRPTAWGFQRGRGRLRAIPVGRRGSDMAGPKDTLGSPWPPLLYSDDEICQRRPVPFQSCQMRGGNADAGVDIVRATSKLRYSFLFEINLFWPPRH
jgi:hypothetical protein